MEKHEHQNKIGPRAGSLRLPNNKPRKIAHLTYYKDKSEIFPVLSLSLQWVWIKEQRQKQLWRLVSEDSKREMATLSLSCLALPSKLRNLSLTGPSSCSSSNQSSTFKSLGFSTNLSHNYLFSNGKCTLYS